MPSQPSPCSAWQRWSAQLFIGSWPSTWSRWAWGSGLFSSPKIIAVKSSVQPEQREIAGTNSMLMNTGMMLSLVVAFPLVLARIPENVMFRVFLYGGSLAGSPQALAAFEMGMHQAFLVAFAIAIAVAVVSYPMPIQSCPD